MSLTNDKLYDRQFDPKKLPKTCLLCGEGELNEMGHIIPKFVMRWLKKASKKELFYLNNSERQRITDTPAIKFLCNDCEDKISLHEKSFTDNHFKKAYRKKEHKTPGDDTYFFAISVAWRLLITTRITNGAEGMDIFCGEIIKNLQKILTADQNSYPNEKIPEVDVHILLADQITSNINPENIRQDSLLYSIRTAIFKNYIYHNRDLRLIATPRGLPIIYFKLGIYYFIVTFKGHLQLLDLCLDMRKIGVIHGVYSLKYTKDIIGFLHLLGSRELSEIAESEIPKNISDSEYLFEIKRSN